MNKKALQAALEQTTLSPKIYDLPLGYPLQDKLFESVRVRNAAVLIAIVAYSREIILTYRSSHLSDHPGQISLPGGGIETHDTNAAATAIREAHEEVALPRTYVDVLGQLPAYQTVTGFCVEPVVGWVEKRPNLTANPHEVEKIFTVPLDWVLNPNNFKIDNLIHRNIPHYFWSIDYKQHYIWGATAAMLHGFMRSQLSVK